MMKFKNTQACFGLVTIVIHWVFALSVFGLFGLGLYMVELTYYDSWYKGSPELHKSIGVVLFSLLVVRLIWRVINVQPVTQTIQKWQQVSVTIVHALLYLLPLSLMISGYLISTADGRGIEVFSLLTIAALPELFNNQEDIAGLVHEVLAWSIIVIAVIHALAALKHHFIEKDQTLNRMIGRNTSL